MSNQPLGKLLKNDSGTTATEVDWDEFQKLAQIGETYKATGGQYKIVDKVYEETMSGSIAVKLFYE